MTLAESQNQSFSNQTIELAGNRFVRCRFVDCTLVLREDPCDIQGCHFERCNWRIERLLRWDDAQAQNAMVGVLDLLRTSVGKPTLAGELFLHAQRQINPFSTHLPVLMACVAATTGPVLELGCGHYSTPILNHMCKHRKVVSVESDAAWMAQFADLAGPNHQFIATQWQDLRLPDLPWDVVFIDHAPSERRVVDIALLMDKAKLLVIHDTEAPSYGYESVLPKFKHRYDYKRWTPWTTVVSQTLPLGFLANPNI